MYDSILCVQGYVLYSVSYNKVLVRQSALEWLFLPQNWHLTTSAFIAGFGWIGLIFLFERDGFDVPVMDLGSTNHTVSIEYCAGFSSTSILETCHKHELKIIHRADRYWYITASGHLVENENPIKDSRDIDFSQ